MVFKVTYFVLLIERGDETDSIKAGAINNDVQLKDGICSKRNAIV